MNNPTLHRVYFLTPGIAVAVPFLGSSPPFSWIGIIMYMYSSCKRYIPSLFSSLQVYCKFWWMYLDFLPRYKARFVFEDAATVKVLMRLPLKLVDWVCRVFMVELNELTIVTNSWPWDACAGTWLVANVAALFNWLGSHLWQDVFLIQVPELRTRTGDHT